jgi:hypothetical protein
VFTFPRGGWRSVLLKITKNGNAYDVLCSVDNVDIGGGGWMGVGAGATLGNVTFKAGISGTATDPIEAIYDNVSMTSQ